MEQQPRSVPQAVEEVVFLSGWKPMLGTEDQTPWTAYRVPLVWSDAAVGTTYNWTGADSWQATLDGQGGASVSPPSAGAEDGRVGGAEQGRGS